MASGFLANGGFGTAQNESIGGLQLGFAGAGWGLALLCNAVMNDDDIVTATPTSSIRSMTFRGTPMPLASVPTGSPVPAAGGLRSVLAGDALGLAVGQPVFATGLRDGASPNNGNFAWEAWYRLPISDAIAITPGVFTLSRPLGSQTPAGQTFSQLAGVLKLSFAC